MAADLRNERWPLLSGAGLIALSTLVLFCASRFGADAAAATSVADGAPHPLFTATKLGSGARPSSGAETQAFSLYTQALHRFEAGQDQEAAALMDQARRQPISTLNLDAGEMSQTSLLLVVTRKGCEHIAQRASDRRDACAWVQRVRGIARQLLDSESPQMEALLTARAIDSKVGRAEAIAMQRLGDRAGGERVAQRESRLQAQYMSEIWGQIALASAHYNQILLNGNSHGETREKLESSDQALAAVLMQRYDTMRTRALASTTA